jgi:hypothetical protein
MTAFVPCTSLESTCVDVKYSYGGVAGVCNLTTGLCQCPPGFSGVDLLSVWNDCHINEVQRSAAEALSLVINVLALMLVTYGIFRLMRSWEAKFFLKYRCLPWIKFAAFTDISYQRQSMERRKRRLFVAIFSNLFNFSVIAVSFQIMLLANPDFSVLERPNTLGLLFLSIQVGAIVLALYLVLYAWFDALPSFRLFSKMFPEIRTSLLVRYPNFVFLSVVINSFLTCSLSFAVFFIYSAARPDQIRDLVIPWGMTLFAIELAILQSFLIAVCVLLIRLLNVFSSDDSGRSSPGRAGLLSPEAKARFTEAKHTIWGMFWSSVICGPIAIALCLVMAWVPYATANFFLFVAVFQGAGAAVCIFISYVFIFRLDYATKRTVENTGLISGQTFENRGSGDGSVSLAGDIHSPNPKFSFIGQEKS